MSDGLILKYRLSGDSIVQGFTTMASGKVVAVAFHQGWPCLWVFHDLAAHQTIENVNPRMTIDIRPTGVFLDEDWLATREHIGTAVSDHLVWHLFKRLAD